MFQIPDQSPPLAIAGGIRFTIVSTLSVDRNVIRPIAISTLVLGDHERSADRWVNVASGRSMAIIQLPTMAGPPEAEFVPPAPQSRNREKSCIADRFGRSRQ